MSTDNSSTRTLDVFFYGLYMDVAVLATKGVTPAFPRRGAVADFTLRIGSKATLLRKPGDKAWGMVYAVTYADLDALYRGLDVYKPEAVLVRTESGVAVAALTMVLLDPPAPEESNPEYATKLRTALTQLGFPVSVANAVT